MKILLLGNWILNPSDQNYNAEFNLKGQADEHTPKKIKSDKVQSISIHIIGNDSNFYKILPYINIRELNKIIAKN